MMIHKLYVAPLFFLINACANTQSSIDLCRLDYLSQPHEIGETFVVDSIITFDGHRYGLFAVEKCPERIPIVIEIDNSKTFYDERLHSNLQSLKIGDKKFKYVGLRGSYKIESMKSDMVNVIMFRMVSYSSISLVEADYLIDMPDPPSKK
jgi:hypothetical protein